MNATQTHQPTLDLHSMECLPGGVDRAAAASGWVTKTVKAIRRADTATHREVE